MSFYSVKVEEMDILYTITIILKEFDSRFSICEMDLISRIISSDSLLKLTRTPERKVMVELVMDHKPEQEEIDKLIIVSKKLDNELDQDIQSYFIKQQQSIETQTIEIRQVIKDNYEKYERVYKKYVHDVIKSYKI